MNLVPINEVCSAAQHGGYAVPAFNIFNHLTLRAVIEACTDARAPVIIQTSVSTVKFHGIERLANLVKSEASQTDIPVCLHLDHCTDPQLAKACVDGGWSSVMIDGSHCPLEENIRITAEITRYAHQRGVGTEGELGAISGVEENIQVCEADACMADVDQSREFVHQTGVDAFAPAVGTAHGMYKGEPKIDYERFLAIRKACGPVPLVVHGGTGLSAEAFQTFVRLGASKINISTAIKHSYLNSMSDFLSRSPDCAPLTLDQYVLDQVQAVVRKHIDIFGARGQA